jgi:23S rRNA (cytidine1920-2'-O)/16S rRNA (cytidine1409-2'-O)-methyltransferase
MAKITRRLDLLIVERGLLPSRQAAQAAIMDGGVLVNGEKITKPGTPIEVSAQLQLTADWQGKKYVSRGGFKLERALEVFAVDVKGSICLDVGASTGGFTDCLLQHGAAKVYAVDVGYGQIDWKLRNDPRVVLLERANIRHLSPAELYKQDDERAALCVIDVSFISLEKVLPACLQLLSDHSRLIALVKPQFEAGRQLVGKGGVVRDPSVHVQVLQQFVEACSHLHLPVQQITFSPIKGPAGNIEFLALLAGWSGEAGEQPGLDIEQLVADAHRQLSQASTD